LNATPPTELYTLSHTTLFRSLITIVDDGGQQTNITTTVTVSGSQLGLTAVPVVATEGIGTPANQLIGTFSDPATGPGVTYQVTRSEEHTSELQSLAYFVCRLL